MKANVKLPRGQRGLPVVAMGLFYWDFIIHWELAVSHVDFTVSWPIGLPSMITVKINRSQN
ncbi:hypothetical protein CUU66_09785 [Peribacillus deserti]|uniref:Uncharacterized protein n=1 Tax=Peribacillus deserti TaxID=673318 RepID=A0A2N5M6P8_9BACI|nr:hypothetical protein CUU66_09785 [Peribacillus deserti]